MTQMPPNPFLQQWLEMWQDQAMKAMVNPDSLRTMLDMMERSAHAAPHAYTHYAPQAPAATTAAEPHAVAMAELERRLRDCEKRIRELERPAKPAAKSRTAAAGTAKRRTKKKS